METIRKILTYVGPWFWGLSVGVLALYGFGLVLGVFTPDELWGWTIVAVVLALLVGWHSRKVHTAIANRDPQVMRDLAKERERRGF